MSLDFQLSEDQLAIRQLAREFAEAEIKPNAIHWDEEQIFPMDTFKKMAELGFLGIMVPTELGGAGLGCIENTIIIEEIARACPGVALSVAAHNGLCSGHILAFANDETKSKYIPALAKGEVMGAWGLTEPSSGSDAGGMQTVGAREGDYYILNGAKNFITHGSYGKTAVIMAITDRSKGAHGISAFVVDKTMGGFSASKKENKLGMRASETSSLLLENVKVPVANLMGNEGEGFVQALKILDGGRIAIAALSVGCAQGAFEAAVKYAQERKQFGKTLAEMQATQFKLAQMAMKLDAARLLTYKAAALRDAGEPYGTAASMAKMFASEACVAICEEAIQIHGGYGYIKEFPVEKYWRDSKLLTIGEGTSEVQRMVIARSVIKEYAS